MNKPFFKLLIFISCFSIPSEVRAQSPGIIYSITESLVNCTLNAFDCNTLQSTVLMRFSSANNFTFNGLSNNEGFDPYNGRFFGIVYINGSPVLRSLDVNIYQLSDSPPIPGGETGAMTYDGYNNRVFIKGMRHLYSYNVLSQKFDTVANTPLINYGTSSGENAFSAWSQQYIFTRICDTTVGTGAPINNTDSIYLVQTNTGTISHRNVAVFPGYPDMQFDNLQQKFYSLLRNGDMVAIDTTTFVRTIISHAVLDSAETNVTSTYDEVNGRFMNIYDHSLPNKLQGRIRIIDVATGNIIADTLFPHGFYQAYMGTPTSFRLQNNNHILKALYGKSYSWTRNDTLIPNEQSQTFKPIQKGNYRCSVTFYNDRLLRSDNYPVNDLNTQAVIPVTTTFPAIPNPAHDHFSIPLPSDKAHDYSLSVRNGLGQLVLSNQGSAKTSIQVTGLQFAQGMYYYELRLDGTMAVHGRLEIQ